MRAKGAEPQAAHRRRHDRHAADRAGHRGRRAGPRRGQALLWNLRKAFPKVRLAWADGIYAGKLVTWATTALKFAVEIVRRPGDLHAFQVLPRRWVVERDPGLDHPALPHRARL
jgi:hypothetical protein